MEMEVNPRLLEKGIIDIPGLGASQEALYVEGLKANLLSISQFCDSDLVVQFSKKECNIFDSSAMWLIGGERTADNCYGLPGLTSDPQIICKKPTIDDSELWHQRLGHLNFTYMLKIVCKVIVKYLPKMEKTGKGVCGPCQLGKHTRAAHKKTSGILTSKNLELLHMDLMGPTRTATLGGRKYILLVVDDFFRYTSAIILREKFDAFDAAQHLFKKIQIEQNCQIMRTAVIMEGSLRMPSFKNSAFRMESSRNSAFRMARVMIHSKNLAQHFWGEAVNAAGHIINRVYLRPETNKTPYEIWRVKKPTVKYFRTFGSKCYILRDRENLGKFDPKSDEAIFYGYSTNSHAYRVFNKRRDTVIEFINVIIDDEEVEAPSKVEENQPISAELPISSADVIKASPGMSPAESLPIPITSDTTASASVDEDNQTNPPKRS
jgi:hypothetical protein